MIRVRHICAVLLVALALSSMPHIQAYLTNDVTRTDTFAVRTNDIEIVETYTPPGSIQSGSIFEKKVQVKNTSEVDCYVRVFAEMETPKMTAALSPDWNTADWTKSGDYYYCNDVLKSSATTEPLLTKIKATAALDDFAMIVYAESIQADSFTSAQDAFAEGGAEQ